MDGFRIQIYNSPNRNAREESGKVRAEFMSKFPDIVSYPPFLTNRVIIKSGLVTSEPESKVQNIF